MPIDYQTSTLTASGKVPVNMYQVSIGIRDARDPAGPELVESSVSVLQLPSALPGIDVLIGLDFLLNCKFLLDGPMREFSLED